MGFKCPKVGITIWPSLGKVSKWLLSNQLHVVENSNIKKPACTPQSEWWIYLKICDTSMKNMNINFEAG